MKTYINAITVIVYLVISVFCSKVYADSPVWKVSKGDSHLYLGGTIHLLSAKDYPLPEAFDVAYKDAVEVVFETDIAAMFKLETQVLMQKALIAQDGKTIDSKLSKETYQQLLEFLSERQIPEQAFSQFTAAGLSLTLLALELQRMGISPSAGVDQYYNLRSIDDEKAIEQLETIEEQISFIDSLNSIDANDLISSTIQDLNKTTEIWPKLVSAWRNGDLLQLEEVGIKPMKDISPSLYQVFLVNRNTNWIDEIEKMLDDEEIEFVLVGALHMAGEHGLIRQLEAANYDVIQLD